MRASSPGSTGRERASSGRYRAVPAQDPPPAARATGTTTATASPSTGTCLPRNSGVAIAGPNHWREPAGRTGRYVAIGRSAPGLCEPAPPSDVSRMCSPCANSVPPIGSLVLPDLAGGSSRWVSRHADRSLSEGPWTAIENVASTRRARSHISGRDVCDGGSVHSRAYSWPESQRTR